MFRAFCAAASAGPRPWLVGTDLRTIVKPSLPAGHVMFAVVVVVPNVVVEEVVVDEVVVPKVVEGGVIVIVWG